MCAIYAGSESGQVILRRKKAIILYAVAFLLSVV